MSSTNSDNIFAPDKHKADTKVVVAMSGGVDSSVVAAKLASEGYNVIGMTMQLYDQNLTLEKKGACCAGKDIYDASMVAEKIGFPHYVLNYENLFKEAVIDDFIDSYLSGETPIPCIKCNQTVKFRDMLKMAKDLGADALATGHYVQRIISGDRVELHKAIDHSKDQSYFLYSTTYEQLQFTHFPLGGLHKTETRELAHKFNLAVKDKPDSQDICFVPNGSYADVIEKYRPGAKYTGEIVDISSGKVLGQHEGIINYTIGQRKGLNIALGYPVYVIKIDASNNIVYVGDESYLAKKTFTIKELNWLAKDQDVNQEIEAMVRLRSMHKGAHARIRIAEGRQAQIELLSPERAITPGQACVIYHDARVLGGGIINR